MRNIKLTISYDGTDFHGWQRQPGLRTVQSVLDEEIERLIQQLYDAMARWQKELAERMQDPEERRRMQEQAGAVTLQVCRASGLAMGDAADLVAELRALDCRLRESTRHARSA